MEELKKGKSVIAKIWLSDKKTGTAQEVEIIYGGEENGFMRTMDGDIRRIIDPEHYKEILQDYYRQQSGGDKADHIIYDGEEAADYDKLDDTAAEPEVQEPERQEPVKASSSALDVRKKEKRFSIENRKLLIPVIIFGSVILITLGLLLTQALTKNSRKAVAPEETVCIALLKHGVNIGDSVTEADFEPSYVSRETFDSLGKTMYIGPDGVSREGAVMLWDDVNKYESSIVLRSIEAGSVAMADDFSLSRSSLTGQTTLRLVAVIRSDGQEDDEIVCELGRYVLEAGTLSDILNSQNISVLDDMAGDGEIQDAPVYEEVPEEEGTEEVLDPSVQAEETDG